MSYNFFDRLTDALGDGIHHWADTLIQKGESEKKHNEAKWGDLNDGFLSPRHHGIRFGQWAISEDTSRVHTLTIAQSGLGKTTGIINCTLLNANRDSKNHPSGSYLVYDESKGIWSVTSGYMASIGYSVRVLDLDDVTNSLKWNPLSHIKNQSDIGKVSALLLSSIQSQSSDPFWIQSAEGLLNIFIELVMNMPPEKRNIGYVKDLITRFGYDGASIDELMAKYGNERMLNAYKFTLNLSERTLSSITQTIISGLKIFDLDNVREITCSTESIDFHSIRNTATCIYLFNSLSNSRYYASLIGLFLTQLTNTLIEKVPQTKEEKRTIYYLLDEVTTLAPSLRGSLSTWMSNLRKYFISINLVVQEYHSLESHFQFDAQNIYANAYVKLFFTSQPLETATKLSQIIGNTTILDEHNKPQIVPLYSQSQIMRMPSDQVLLVAGNRDVYKFSIVPFYKQNILNFRSKIPPVYHA